MGLTQAVIDEPIVGNKSTKSVDAVFKFAMLNTPTLVTISLADDYQDQVEHSLKVCKTNGTAIDTFRSKHHPYPTQQVANTALVNIVMRSRAVSIG